MRLFFIALFFSFISITAQGANVDKDIVTGAFSSPDRAHFQNMKVEAYLGNYPSMSPMLKEKRFYFDVKYFNGNYRAVMTHFQDENDLLGVLNTVRRIYPDAYTTASTPALIPPEKPKTVPASKEKTTSAPVKHPSVTTQKVTKTAPKPQPAKAEAVHRPETAAAAPATRPSFDAGAEARNSSERVLEETDITVIDEPEETVQKTKQQEIIPVTEDVTEQQAAPAEPETATGESSFLLYGIGGAAAILVLLLFFARRKAKPASTLKAPRDINLSPIETVVSGETETRETETYETEVETAPAPTEPPVPFEEEPAAGAGTSAFETIPAPIEAIEESVEFPGEAAAPEVVPHPVEPLPAVTPRKKRDLRPHLEPITKEKLSDFAGSRILVAEDNMINQKVISKLFEGSGIEIVIAENGQEAIDILNNDPNFNMILMDAHMPVKDGFEATREIRRNILFEPVVVVALSGDVGSDDIRKMKEAGMEEQLAKPLRVEALYDVMYQYLDFAGEADSGESEEEFRPVTEFEEPSLNKAEGLEVCGGDKGMYLEILEEFVQTYGSSDRLVESYIGADDDIKLVALMLDIKGVAANIGADPLSEIAETLREAVLINQVEAYKGLSEEYSKELHRLLIAVEAFKQSF